MNKQYINIGIAGLSIHDSDELKNQLSHILPNNFSIQWKTASDINLDCLFIHEHFFETEGIQRILSSKHFPWLKIAKDRELSGKVTNDTLYLPLRDTYELNRWLNKHIIHTETEQTVDELELPVLQNKLPSNHPYHEKYFKEMASGNAKMHIFDQRGTIAILDPAKNLVWLPTEQKKQNTDFSFRYDLASTSDMVKVSRKDPAILQDWLFNLFWNSTDYYQITPEDGHYKINSWPKPNDTRNRKMIFQMSACFIQGAKISQISELHNIPLQMVRQFIAANMASGNALKINAWDSQYSPPETAEKTEEQSFIKNFFGKIRMKFGF